MLPPYRAKSQFNRIESAEYGRAICVHELEAALADLAGVDRRSPEVPDGIRTYAAALWDRLVSLPQCPSKENV